LTKKQNAKVLSLWITALCDHIKNTHGKDMSPTVVMTDAGKAEHNAIKEVFPNARCFLCAFHVAQAVFNKLNSVLPSTAWLDVESLEKGGKQVE